MKIFFSFLLFLSFAAEAKLHEDPVFEGSQFNCTAKIISREENAVTKNKIVCYETRFLLFWRKHTFYNVTEVTQEEKIKIDYKGQVSTSILKTPKLLILGDVSKVKYSFIYNSCADEQKLSLQLWPFFKRKIQRRVYNT